MATISCFPGNRVPGTRPQGVSSVTLSMGIKTNHFCYYQQLAVPVDLRDGVDSDGVDTSSQHKISATVASPEMCEAGFAKQV
jgi:hypothetical protein